MFNLYEKKKLLSALGVINISGLTNVTNITLMKQIFFHLFQTKIQHLIMCVNQNVINLMVL